MLPVARHGTCPQCQSRAVQNVNEEEKHYNGVKMGAASLVLILVGLPLLLFGIGIFLIIAGIILGIVASFLPNKRLISTYRTCRDCGHQWRF